MATTGLDQLLRELVAIRKSKTTQSEMARQLHVTQSTVSQFENGGARCRFDNLMRYAEVLGVTINFEIVVPEEDE